LIEQEKYFVLHAPRQTGKTTCLLALMEHLNQTGNYTCLYCNVEAAQAAREDVHKAMTTILGMVAHWASRLLGEEYLETIWEKAQVVAYMDLCGTDEGHLVLFDRTPGKPWEEKIFQKIGEVTEKKVKIWGM
jgi:hypothetical protein